ncbi:hypothetical protein E3A20_23850 [Planctomyces bekefii]|uniref:Uncharacterized protein n=1 Tax=Planctomyces bekefii TaxID=1653850 RepID=A0A5C6M2I9_9PLAN|nr:hypothetical protein E3A20_23850 [Planctomyces bekefii]
MSGFGRGWLEGVGAGWGGVLSEPAVAAALGELRGELEVEWGSGVAVYPAEGDIFAALRLTPLERVRVVIVRQDPYHDVGQAHGLSFSVPASQRIPPSLRNIYRELAADVGCGVPGSGCLTGWADGAGACGEFAWWSGLGAGDGGDFGGGEGAAGWSGVYGVGGGGRAGTG